MNDCLVTVTSLPVDVGIVGPGGGRGRQQGCSCNMVGTTMMVVAAGNKSRGRKGGVFRPVVLCPDTT